MTNRLLLDAIHRWVVSTPTGVAFETSDGSAVSYLNLWNLAGDLSAKLTPHTRRLMVEASGGVLCTIGTIAALRAGVDVALLDPSLPKGRRAQVIDIVAPDTAFGSGALGLPLSRELTTVTRNELSTSGAPKYTPADVSSRYFVFTSGSTARPKGIVGRFEGVENFVSWQGQRYKIGPGSRFGALTAPSFDVFLRDMLTPLTRGATIVVPPENWLSLGLDVLKWLKDKEVTHLHTVPALAKAWLRRHGGEGSGSLQRTFFAGEPLYRSLVRQWTDVFPSSAITNLYGPSETTLAAFYQDLDEERAWISDPAPVGRPIPGVRVFILDEERKALEAGEKGEIGIVSPHRSHGYVDTAITGDRFVALPNLFESTDEDSVVYLTGDSGYRTLDGVLVLTGRMDDEVKVAGVRVHPRSIAELILKTSTHIRECAVVADPERDNNLIAFLQAHDDGDIDEEEIRQNLAKHLPQILIPFRYILLQEYPLTESGKVDKKTLQQMIPRATEERAGGDEDAGIIGKVCGVWSEVLGYGNVSSASNFFELGGTSLLALELAGTLSDRLDRNITPIDILEYRTPKRLVQHMELGREVKGGEAAQNSQVVDRRSDGIELPWSPSQRAYLRLYEGELHSSGVLFLDVLLPNNVKRREIILCMEFLAARHEALRTIKTRHDGKSRQRILDCCSSIDVAGLVQDSTVNEGGLDLSAERQRLLRQGLPRDGQPMWRGSIVWDAEHGPTLVLMLHHVICDGVSARILKEEILDSFSDPPPKRRSGLPMSQVIRMKSSQEDALTQDPQRDYWARYLADASLPMLLDEIESPNLAGRRLRLSLDTSWKDRIDEVAQSLRVSSASLYYSAYLIVCHAVYKRQRVVVVTPITGRGGRGFERTVGNLMNLVCIKNTADQEENCDELITRVAEDLIGAQRNGEYAFDRLWKAESGRPSDRRFPISGALIGVMPLEREARRLKAIEESAIERRILYDLHAFFFENADRVDIELHHRLDIIPAQRADEILRTLTKVLERLVAEPRSSVRALVDSATRGLCDSRV